MTNAKIIIAIAICTAATGPAATGTADELTFEKDVRPIFRAHCYDCHGASDDREGGLDLRLVRLMAAGGDSGPAIVPGAPQKSYLLQRLRAGEMPPGENRVPDHDIATIERWIAAGAPTSRPEPETIGAGLGMTDEERSFWSFQLIRRPEVPNQPAAARARTPIDALVLAAIPEGLSFSADADRLTLIKRAYLELSGLPPAPEQVDPWIQSKDEDWFHQLVENLLASPHYGEHWARHWLDVAGYADSEGQTESDQNRPWAWNYRDWVIRSLNADKPFNRFVMEQIAGDELAGPKEGEFTREQIDELTATGFLRMAADGTGAGADKPEDRNQVIADTIRIVSTSLMGLSVHCAQCHDHRYDPIPQSDYYALRAVFEPALDWQKWQTPKERLVSLYTEADREQAAEVEKEAIKIIEARAAQKKEYEAQALQTELEKHDEPLRTQLREAFETPDDQRTDAQKLLLKKYPKIGDLKQGPLYLYIPKWRKEAEDWAKRIEEARAKKPPEIFLRALVEPADHTPETRLFHRGLLSQPKQVVMPASLTVTVPDGARREFATDDESLPTTGRRLSFAKWLTSGDHPLVPRVIVNRVWMHHFGRGIVATPSDFGKQGARPTHPELLDWLAAEFVRNGWSLKWLHRQIMTSTVWMQSSADSGAEAAQADPQSLDPTNQFYWRKRIVRLEAEAFRDRMLAASGTLESQLYGAPQELKEDYRGQTIVEGDATRRSMYVRVRRTQPVDMLHTFDAPTMETNCERRIASTVATQALVMMNSEFTLEQAAKLAARAESEAEPLDGETYPTLPALPESQFNPWQFGYGTYDQETDRTASFNQLPYWSGKDWAGSTESLDPVSGFVRLNANGGHPDGGSDAIRRWIAPRDGVISIAGTFEHESEAGNGVHSRLVSSRSGQLGDWTAAHSQCDTNVAELVVEQGDTVDFITDPNSSTSSDNYSWKVTISLTSEDGHIENFSSVEGFHGPLDNYHTMQSEVVRAWQLALCRKPTDEELRLAIDFILTQIHYLENNLDRVPKDVTISRQVMTNLCQALMGSNEFLYVY